MHCVKAAPQLLKLAREEAPFPAGLVLHSFLGPADLVKPFAGIQGCYFSISGHSLRSPKKAPGIVSQVLSVASSTGPTYALDAGTRQALDGANLHSEDDKSVW